MKYLLIIAVSLASIFANSALANEYCPAWQEPSSGSPDPVAEATQALQMWQVLDVQQDECVLTIVLNERMVAEDLYMGVMRSGLCFFVEAIDLRLDGIGFIAVINQFQRSGWVFEGGAAECLEIAGYPRDERELQYLARTHQY